MTLQEMSAARKAPLGSGKRFQAITQSAAASGARDPQAVAAAAGMKAHGKATMMRLARAGKRRKFGDGGVVDKPTNATIGEKGPEAVVPVASRKAGEALVERYSVRRTNLGDGPRDFSDPAGPSGTGYVESKTLESRKSVPLRSISASEFKRNK